MLKIQNLSAGYREDFVIRDISVEIEPNILLGIIGRNGSGKSTLIKAIAGILDFVSGKIFFRDKEVLRYNRKEIFSYIPQEIFLSFGFSVYELLRMSQRSYINFLGRLTKQENERIEETISEFELKPLLNRSILNLSGGERKRVMIARGIAQMSEVVLLDEPLSGLDIDHQVRVFESLMNIAHRGRIIIASVHDLNIAAQFCDRIILIGDGKIIKYGRVEEVLTYSNIKTYFGIEVYVGVNEINQKRFLIPFK